MSGSLCLAKDELTGDLTALNINSSGELVVTTGGGGGGTTNVDIVADSVGLATEATLTAVATESTLSTLATEATASAMNVNLNDINSNITACNTGAVVVSSSALPAGASTSALQTSGNTSLTTIADGFYADGDSFTGTDQGVMVMGRNGTNVAKPIRITGNGDVEVEIADFVKGQAVSASSFPVVLASDQSNLKVIKPDASVTTDSLAPIAGATAVTTGVDLDGTNGNVTFFGSSSNLNDPIVVEFSDDDVTYYPSNDFFINVDVSGNYGFSASNLGVRYIRLTQTDTFLSAWTWTSKASKK